MEMSNFANRNMSLFGITVGKVKVGQNITDAEFSCTSNLVRIYAKTDLIIKSNKYSAGVGIELPQGMVEYFEVEKDEKLNIQGTANLCCM